jgi:hypothetical protein
MSERNRSAQDDRRRLADDVRRTAGYMEAVVSRARRLDVLAPPAVSACVDLWRGWFRSMDRQAGEGP